MVSAISAFESGKKEEQKQAYDRSKFRGIRDTIPRNFVTQLLFSTKFTFVSPFAKRKQVRETDRERREKENVLENVQQISLLYQV